MSRPKYGVRAANTNEFCENAKLAVKLLLTVIAALSATAVSKPGLAMVNVPEVEVVPVATTYLLESPAIEITSPALIPVALTVPVSKVMVVSPIAAAALLMRAPVIPPFVTV